MVSEAFTVQKNVVAEGLTVHLFKDVEDVEDIFISCSTSPPAPMRTGVLSSSAAAHRRQLRCYGSTAHAFRGLENVEDVDVIDSEHMAASSVSRPIDDVEDIFISCSTSPPAPMLRLDCSCF
ncbi:unnamed protein product [Caenorhabditis auriculariae]|uniref:Uncharacterized protein n=1 Tax=Caenorhabditis auriculariae TaxID=2777116 RepID=A0A8S1GY00_9PELO|nr:unnamed protein product [Caenorhabditis auriculariae]